MPQRKPEVTRRTAAGIPYELTRKKVKRLNLHIRRDGTVAVSIPWSYTCLLYTSPSPRDKRQSRMPSSA